MTQLLNMSEEHEQWCVDQQKNDLKQLMVHYEDLDVRLELIECLYAQWDPKQVEKLKKRVTTLEEYVGKLEDRVEMIDEGDVIKPVGRKGSGTHYSESLNIKSMK